MCWQRSRSRTGPPWHRTRGGHAPALGLAPLLQHGTHGAEPCSLPLVWQRCFGTQLRVLRLACVRLPAGRTPHPACPLQGLQERCVPPCVPCHPAGSGLAPGEGVRHLGQQLVPSFGGRPCGGSCITRAPTSLPVCPGLVREPAPAAGTFPCAHTPSERVLPGAGPERGVRPRSCCSLSPLDPSWGLGRGQADACGALGARSSSRRASDPLPWRCGLGP